MANYTLTNTKSSYLAAWQGMDIKPDILPKAQSVADKIISLRNRYDPLEIATGVPWYFIGLLHMRESNFNFETHLHNGDPLADKNGNPLRTKNEPKGYPKEPPQNGVSYTFEESAIDALTKEFGAVKEWSIEQIAYYMEKYNGFGYRMKGLPSPYLWSGSNQYVKGKYIKDKVFDPTVVDQQLGCMVVLKCVLDKTQPLPVVNSESVVVEQAPVGPISPAAEDPIPTHAEMRQKSRKFWLTDWMEKFFAWGAGGTTVATTLDIGNIQATRTYVDTIKSFAISHGVFVLIFALVVGFIVSRLIKIWMAQDIAEGRTTMSGDSQ